MNKISIPKDNIYKSGEGGFIICPDTTPYHPTDLRVIAPLEYLKRQLEKDKMVINRIKTLSH